jgi:hypothetical protein
VHWLATKWLPLVVCSTVLNTLVGWLIITMWPGLDFSLKEVASYAFVGAALMATFHGPKRPNTVH